MGLFFGCVLFFILFLILVAFGHRGGDTFFDNMRLSTPILIAGISGISAFFTGIIGVIKSRERSIIVFISTVVGFFALLFLLGELLFPH